MCYSNTRSTQSLGYRFKTTLCRITWILVPVSRLNTLLLPVDVPFWNLFLILFQTNSPRQTMLSQMPTEDSTNSRPLMLPSLQSATTWLPLSVIRKMLLKTLRKKLTNVNAAISALRAEIKQRLRANKTKNLKVTVPKLKSQLAFYVNLHRAVIGPSATLTGRWRPDIDLRRMLTGVFTHYIISTVVYVDSST